jgi:predicted ATPase
MHMEPCAAYAAAFTEFTNEVVARSQDLEIKETIYMAVKAETMMLTNMIPALKKIVGRQREDASVVPSQDLANRFAFVFRLFLGAISTPERPLVFFLDDLHKADECRLGLLAKLVSDIDTNDVLFLCTCSDDLAPSNAVCKMLCKLEEEQVQITNIAISSLCIDNMSEMVARPSRRNRN